MTTTHSRANARTKSLVDRPAVIPAEPRVVVATVTTSHFEWVAVGATAEDAKIALVAAWNRHRQTYTGADPGYMREAILQGEVTFHFLPMGGASRDGEAV